MEKNFQFRKKKADEMSGSPSQNKIVAFLEVFLKIWTHGLIFLLPLFFLPWTANIVEFNKQALLFGMGFLGVFVWIIKSLIEGKLIVNLSFLNVSIGIFVLISGLSVIFSQAPSASFWGWPLNISH